MPHFVVFSGHLIDKPNRDPPRFPESKSTAAGIAIRQALQKIQTAIGASTPQAIGASAPQDISTPAPQGIGASAPQGINTPALRGIAAAACGGDILFHEACQALHIPSEIYLAIPVDAFEKTSVAFAGEDWIARYQKLVKNLPVHILDPKATADAADEVWEKANQWMLDTALATGGAETTIVTLWDGNKGATGGTGHMLDVAKEQNAAVIIIDIQKL